MSDINLKVKRLHPDAILPTYATDGSGCFDLYSMTADWLLPTGTNKQFETGLAFQIPEDHVMLVFSRSGHGFKHNVRLTNAVGVIDSDYTGQVMVAMTSDHDVFEIEKGDRIAQALVIPIPKVSFTEVDELSGTTRGTNGFGSTGA